GTLVMGSTSKQPVRVAAGGVEIPFTPTANSATFAENSLLAVYAPNALGAKAALNANVGKLTVDANSKLMIVNGRVGETVKIASGFTHNTSAIDSTGWTGTNLLTNSEMVTASPTAAFAAGTGTYNIKIAMGKSAGELFPQLQPEAANLVTALYAQGLNDTQGPNAGIKFLSRATANNEKYVDNAHQAASTIEGAAQLAVAGATQGMTLSALNAATNAVTTRTSFASPLLDKAKAVAVTMDQNGNTSLDSGLSAGNGMKNGLGVWIMPLYQSENVWGMKAENFKTGYNADLGGVALGADYTFADAFRVGMALNLGGGYAQSSGDFNKTDNSFSFWGVGLYGGWTQNNFGLTADVGYTSNYNKIQQELPRSMEMSNIKADVTSSAITAGLRGEYKFQTEMLDIIPHVGVRFIGIKTDAYDSKSNGTLFKTDESYQNVWTFPIGVTLAKEIESESGWIFRPQLDLQVIPAAGDTKAKSKVRVPGVDASAELKTRVMDDITYGGGIGFDVKKDNLSFGINYNIQASEHRTGHGVFGTVRYEF
ncbi:MAG: autotransporter outer membrane beta-barrel domain-containing protein, partial [Desulfovibrionaceae bacterium]